MLCIRFLMRCGLGNGKVWLDVSVAQLADGAFTVHDANHGAGYPCLPIGSIHIKPDMLA